MNSIGWPDSIPSPLAGPEITDAGPQAFERVYPNPCADATSLRFQVERNASDVRLEIFDLTGRRVAVPLDRVMTRGTHVVGWNTRDRSGRWVAPGVYFARLTVNGSPAGAKKMTVLR